jgi:transcriptional regulator GlxA family with amidase domain
MIPAMATSSKPRPSRSRTRRIAMLAYPDIQILDVTGPLEVFARTSRWLHDHGHRPKDDAYTVEIIGIECGRLLASSGLALFAERGYREVGAGIDTLLISGGRGTESYCHSKPLLAWIQKQSRLVRRLASVCTGAFFLAEAGLLDGLRATTHWGYTDDFARRFPNVALEPDKIFIKQGSIYTAAGVTSGIDLALALVEEDHGRETALAVARALVMFLRRPGGQTQFSAQLSSQIADHEPLRDLQAYILDHPEADLTVENMARRVAMSPRHFARVFAREVGAPPARYVTRARVETARRLLEESSEGLDQICERTGLGSAESMRRAFLKIVGVPPSHYRQRFHGPPSENDETRSRT